MADAHTLACLKALEHKVLWLSSWMIHHANHIRPNIDGLKVGGHQASSASLVTLMTALYLYVLKPQDRVAVKPHASPVFHAIQYLLGNQELDQLRMFRAFGGAQSYPSRTKDADDVDFSTGSVGLGVGMTSVMAMVQDYLQARNMLAMDQGARMIALVGDAELDEGNVFEALLEGWKHKVRNLWWVVDYNRQSLDAVIADRLFARFNRLFASMGWRVVTIKYGKKLQQAFTLPGGEALRQWIDTCPNSLYSALVVKGGSAWRNRIVEDIGNREGVEGLLARFDDTALENLVTDLGGHCLESILEAFAAVDDDQPTCFIAYTIKGHDLPLAGHKDNHSGILNPQQMAVMRERHGIVEGEEWQRFSGLAVVAEELQSFLDRVPFVSSRQRRLKAPPVRIPRCDVDSKSGELSTQEAFGRLLGTLARSKDPGVDNVVTTSPDVTVSTNLGSWVNQRGVFHRQVQSDTFKSEGVGSFQRWSSSPEGQHIELGIAENNFFLMLGALGLSHSLMATRLLPIGTVYDPFIVRGLDALNYACYQDARFILVATPSGLSLAPEGGAHQSFSTPLIGMAQPGLAAFEPAYGDELAVLMNWAFEYLQREGASREDLPLCDAGGGSVYLRLTTRSIAQPQRIMNTDLAADIISGGYWLRPPDGNTSVVIAYSGVLAPEALAACEWINDSVSECALLAVTSADRLHQAWQRALEIRQRGVSECRSHTERLLDEVPPQATIISVVDAHPGTLSWLGSVNGHRVRALGVTAFGQSGALPDLYKAYGIDSDAILRAYKRTGSKPTGSKTAGSKTEGSKTEGSKTEGSKSGSG